MNEQVELVKKWRADKDSVSIDELEAAYFAAHAARAAAYAASVCAADEAAGRTVDVAYWIERYEELTDVK